MIKILCLFASTLSLAPSCYAQPGGDPFGALKSSFQGVVSTQFGASAITDWASVSTYVTNQFISSNLSAEFNKSNVTISGDFPDQPISPQPSEIDLTVKTVLKSCDFNCGSCNISPLSWGNCACDVAAYSPPVLACKAANAIISAAGGVSIGKLTFHDVNLAAHVDPTVLTLAVTPAIDSAALSASIGGIHASAGGRADWGWTSIAGLFTACAPQTVSLSRTGLTLSNPSFPMVSAINVSSNSDGAEVDIQVSGGSIDANIQDPALQIAAANPQLMTTCPIGFAILTAPVISGQIIPSSHTFTLPSQSLNLNLANLHLPAANPGEPPTQMIVRKTSLALGVTTQLPK